MTTMPVTIPERIPMPLDVAGRPAGAGAGLSAGDVVRILKRRVFLVLFIWIATTAAVAGLTAYLIQAYPLYQASAAVFVESPFPKTPLEMGERLLRVELMDRFVADQAVLLKDPSILTEVLKARIVQETGWFRSQPSDYEAQEELKEDLRVRQIPRTNYLSVSFSTHEAVDAPVIVNTAINKYLDRVNIISRETYRGELQEYEQTGSRLEEQIERIRAQKETFVSLLGMPGVTEGLNVIGETWRALAAEVTRLEAEKLQYQAAYDNLRGVDPLQIALSPQVQRAIEEDYEISSLRNAKLAIERELRVLRQDGFGESHRQVRQRQATFEAIERQLRDERAAKEQEARTYQLNFAETMYLNATQAVMQLQDRMLESEARQRDLDRGLVQYRNLEDQQILLEDRHGRILDYISQLRMIVEARGMVRVRPIGQAETPEERHFPRWEYNLPAGCVFGLMLGVGIVMLLELVDTSVKTSRDIVRHVHVPILGTIPDLDDEEVPIDQIELACHTNPRSMIAEAFRTVRTNLLLSSPADRQRSVLVTSSKPEEGKTSVAVNLAISIAQSGRRVLLVDANFHRPTLHQLFPKARREGLSNVLIGQSPVDGLASRTDLPNLDVLTSGPIPPNPTELLAGSYLKEMITQATERYDQIIFDGPPALLVSDVLVMTGGVDGVILVCRARTSSRGTVQRAREQLERVDGHMFGAVLNAAQVTRGGYFREQIRTFYDYQSEEALAADTSRALPQKDQDSSEA